MIDFQVTLGAAATAVTSSVQHINAASVTIQNNTTHALRVGSKNYVSATKGISLSPGGGSFTITRSDNRIPLYQYFLFGTNLDAIDVIVEN